MKLSSQSRLSLILWLVALHSAAVGCGLIVVPPEGMRQFGYGFYQERFFSVQAGVFHFVMVVAYSLAAAKPDRYRGLVLLSIIAKFMATAFLFIYYVFADPIWVVLFSGIADFLMGLLILWAFATFKKSAPSAGRERAKA